MNNILSFLVFLGVVFNTPVYGSEVNLSGDPQINISCQSTPLKEVVDSVHEQTGYIIHVEKRLLSMTITGEFNRVQIGPFFQRIFKGKNILLQCSDEKKSCIVKTFDLTEKDYYATGKNNSINLLTGVSLGDADHSFNKQKKDFLEYSQNTESVDSLTGVKLIDIRRSQAEQKKVFLENSQKLDSVDLLSGKTLGVLRESNDQQRAAFQNYSENADSIDQLTNRKLIDIKKSDKQQRDEFYRFSSDPNSIDPLTGLTLGQIKESQAKQRKEFLAK
jgi:hypothetical protein